MNMKKLLNASNIVACLVALLSLIALILYGANVSTKGFYQGMTIQNFVLLGVFTIVACLGIIGLSFLPKEGVVGKVVNVVTMVLKVLIPVFLFSIVLAAISSRISGLGYIFFSNENVRLEVATPENLASAGVAITTIIFAAVAGLVGIVGAFFLPKTEE